MRSQLDITVEEYAARCADDPRFAGWYAAGLKQRDRARARALVKRAQQEKEAKGRILSRWHASRVRTRHD